MRYQLYLDLTALRPQTTIYQNLVRTAGSIILRVGSGDALLTLLTPTAGTLPGGLRHVSEAKVEPYLSCSVAALPHGGLLHE